MKTFRPVCLVLSLSVLAACSKSEPELDAYRYGITTPKGAVYPPAVELYLGDESLGTLGDYRDEQEDYLVELQRPLDAPLSKALDRGLSLRWSSPCGVLESKLVPDEGADALAKDEASQAKLPRPAYLETKASEPPTWSSSKLTYVWTDVPADGTELTVGKMTVPAKKGEAVAVYGIGCAERQGVAFGKTTASVDVKALAAFKERSWDDAPAAWDGDDNPRNVFIGQAGKCYALRTLTYSNDGWASGPETKVLKGGEVHILPRAIDYLFEDAPDGVTVEDDGIVDTVRRLELKATDCP